MSTPKTVGQRLVETFSATVTVTHRGGVRVAPDPPWMSRRSNRGSDIGPPVVPYADLVRASRGRRK